MFCSKCGKPIKETDKFCPNCGAKLGEMTAVAKVNRKETPAVHAMPQYTMQPQPIVTMQQTSRPKARRAEKKDAAKKMNPVPEVILPKVQFESRDLNVVQLAKGPTQAAVRFVEGAAVFVAILLISIFSIIFFVTPIDLATGETMPSVDVFTHAFFGEQSLVQGLLHVHETDAPLSIYLPYLVQLGAAIATIIGSIAAAFYGLAAFIRYMSGKRGRSIVPVAVFDLTINLISALIVGFFGKLTIGGFSLYEYTPGVEMQAALWSGFTLIAAVAVYKIVISHRVYLMPTNLLRTVGYMVGIVVGVAIVAFGTGIGLHELVPYMVPADPAVEGQTPLFMVGCYAIVVLLLLITIAAANMARKCMSAVAAENSHGYAFRLYSYFYSIRDYCTTTWLLAIGSAVLLVIMNFFVASQLGGVLDDMAGGNYFDNALLILIFAILGVVASMVCNGMAESMRKRDAEYIAECVQHDEAERIGGEAESYGMPDADDEEEEEQEDEEGASIQSVVVQPIMAQPMPSPIVIAPIAQPMQPPLNEEPYTVTDVSEAPAETAVAAEDASAEEMYGAAPEEGQENGMNDNR